MGSKKDFVPFGEREKKFQTAGLENYNLLKQFAKENRAHPTDAERVMWELLRDKAEGVKFRRQHIIGNYIADFVCLSHQIVVELDGRYHLLEGQQQSDKERTEYFTSLGFHEIRFSNEEVLQDTDRTLDRLLDFINEHAK